MIAPGVDASAVAACLHDAVAGTVDATSRFGVSVLPGEAGAWLRLVGDDTVATGEVARAAWAAVRLLLTGRPAPRIRRVTRAARAHAQAASANGRPAAAATASIVPNVRS